MITSMKRSLQSSKTWYRSMLAGNPKMEYGAYELISTAYGTGSSGTITFSSIPQDYKHLQIRAVTRSTAASAFVNIAFRLNNDSGANYTFHYLQGDGSAVNSGAFAGLNETGYSYSAGASATSGIHSPIIFDVADYVSTSKNKTVRNLSGNVNSGSNLISLRSGLWLNTSAVTSLSVLALSGNWTTTSRFSLYGVKG